MQDATHHGSWYWLDTGWACGAIFVSARGEVISDGAPIFRSLFGQRLVHVLVKSTYRVFQLSEEDMK